MSDGSNGSTDDVPLFDSNTELLYFIQFWIFLILFIPSFICSVFDLYHLLRDRALRRALHNHVIIVLLVINLFFLLTDILLYIYYFRNYETWSPSPGVRFSWSYFDWTFSYVQFVLYAWVTIERHILVFHDHLVSTKKKRLFVHYLPPAILIIYAILYYTLVLFAGPCENVLYFQNGPIIFPCVYINSNALSLYELVIQEILPIFTIVLSSVVLLLRVLWQKYFVRQQINWTRYGKMVVQLLSISLIYLVFPFPYIFIALLHLCGVPAEFGADFLASVLYCFYYVMLLFPMVVLASSTELRGKLKETLLFGRRRRQQRTVAPAPTIRANMVDNRVTIQ